MLNFPYIYGGGGSSEDGVFMDLDPNGLFTGSGNGWIENKANVMPFNWGLFGGYGGATQGTDEIELAQTAYIEIPFNTYLLARQWELEYTFNVDTFSGKEYTTLWEMSPVGSGGCPASISYRSSTDRLYYAIGETGQAITPTPIAADVVASDVANCLEDNGFKSAQIVGHDITLKLVKDATYMTVYVNDSARIKVPSYVVEWYGSNGNPICNCFRFGAAGIELYYEGFNGSVKQIKMK